MTLLAIVCGACTPRSDEMHDALQRDLLAHFSTLSSIRVTAVDATLLREQPTQTGAAHPEYYAWVVLRSDAGQTRSGAVRVVAPDATHFEVADFLSKQVLAADPAVAARVFPSGLVAEINRRALE